MITYEDSNVEETRNGNLNIRLSGAYTPLADIRTLEINGCRIQIQESE